MPSAVETLFSKGDAEVLDVLPAIEAFMNNPVRVGALRLVLLGLASKSRKTEFSFTPLFHEWGKLLGLMGAKGNRATKQRAESSLEFNENTIRRYVLLENEPRQAKRLTALLALLAAHEIGKVDGVEGSQNRLVKSGRDVSEFIEPISNYVTTRDPSTLAQSPDYGRLGGAATERMAAKSLRALFSAQSEDQRNIARWLFARLDGREVMSFEERSYYVLYRYSTQSPEIVKTLLVIDSPALSGLDAFSFTHIYQARPDIAKRITRGTLICFPQAMYFVGMSANVLWGLDPLGRPKMDHPQGLKVFVIPTTEAQTKHDLLAGVYMSNSLRWDPIVGRIILVHIGFRTEVGSLSDAVPELRPTVLADARALERDLLTLTSIPKCSITREGVPDLARRANIRINNRPFCDSAGPTVAADGITRALQPEDEQIPGP